MFKTIIKEIKNRNRDTDIIQSLLEGMIELKVSWTEAHEKLVQESQKRIKN